MNLYLKLGKVAIRQNNSEIWMPRTRDKPAMGLRAAVCGPACAASHLRFDQIRKKFVTLTRQPLEMRFGGFGARFLLLAL